MWKVWYSEEKAWESLKESSFSYTQEMLTILSFNKSG